MLAFVAFVGSLIELGAAMMMERTLDSIALAVCLLLAFGFIWFPPKPNARRIKR